MTTKLLATGALGMALAASPFFALAHDMNADADANVRAPIADKTTVSIAIADNGSVLVRGAKVTDVSDDAITAETTVNDVTLTWEVDTDSDTDYVNVSTNDMNRNDVSDGDYVSFSGELTGSNVFTVNADTIRDWSEGESNPPKVGFWAHMSSWPIFSFFGHAKAGR